MVISEFLGLEFASETVARCQEISINVETCSKRKSFVGNLVVLMAFDPGYFDVASYVAGVEDDDAHEIKVVWWLPGFVATAYVSKDPLDSRSTVYYPQEFAAVAFLPQFCDCCNQ